MKLRALVPVAAFAACALSAAAVHADEPAARPVTLRSRWKADDVISRTSTSTETLGIAQVKDGQVQGQMHKEDKETRYELVAKCTAADASGHWTDGALYFASWSLTTAEGKDECLSKVHVRLTGFGPKAETTILTAGAEVSEAAKAWLTSEFGAGSTNDALLAVLEPKGPVAVDATWDVTGGDLVGAVGNEVQLDPAKSGAKLGLVKSEGGLDTIHGKVVMQLAGLPAGEGGRLLPWKDDKGAIELAFVHVKKEGTHEATTEMEAEGEGIADAGDSEIHFATKQTQKVVTKVGGTMPDLPNVK